jgi:hypothetical protein
VGAKLAAQQIGMIKVMAPVRDNEMGIRKHERALLSIPSVVSCSFHLSCSFDRLFLRFLAAVGCCAEHGPPRHRSCHPSAWSQGSQWFRQALRSSRDSLVPCSQELTVCCSTATAMAAVVVIACVC